MNKECISNLNDDAGALRAELDSSIPTASGLPESQTAARLRNYCCSNEQSIRFTTLWQTTSSRPGRGRGYGPTYVGLSAAGGEGVVVGKAVVAGCLMTS